MDNIIYKLQKVINDVKKMKIDKNDMDEVVDEIIYNIDGIIYNLNYAELLSKQRRYKNKKI